MLSVCWDVDVVVVSSDFKDSNSVKPSFIAARVELPVSAAAKWNLERWSTVYVEMVAAAAVTV